MGNDQKVDKKPSFKEPILAAGAVLWRKEAFTSEIAVIHRTRYGDEWCLPKGKVNKGETLEAAALREVKEETGCSAKIIRFARVTEYPVKGIKKLVFYWHMVVENESSWDKRDSEVDQIVWLPPEEALKLLDHKDQRKLIKDLLARDVKPIKRKWFRFSKNALYHRLAGALKAYRRELEYKKPLPEPQGNEKYDWFGSCIRLLSDSETLLNSRDLDGAWKCFHAAQRIEIYSLNVQQLNVKVSLLNSESQKLRSWRKEATLELLNPSNFSNTSEPKTNERETDGRYERVYQAAIIRDESFTNQAHKYCLVKEHIRFLALAAILVGLILLLFRVMNPVLFKSIPQHTLILLHCPFFGMFGAILSVAFNVKVNIAAQSSRIPELLNTRALTTLRILIGGISAFILCIFVKSQFISNILYIDLQDMPAYLYSFYFIAFVAGFSERFILRAINSVAKDSDEGKSK